MTCPICEREVVPALAAALWGNTFLIDGREVCVDCTSDLTQGDPQALPFVAPRDGYYRISSTGLERLGD